MFLVGCRWLCLPLAEGSEMMQHSTRTETSLFMPSGMAVGSCSQHTKIRLKYKDHFWSNGPEVIFSFWGYR